LEGSKLTAFHETTRQPRATINLAKASRLIDDKSTLTKTEFSGKGGARRRSAFAADEEGYMFVEEGFRVRFANGEVIDFYADNTAEKEGWMRALAEVVGKDSKSSKSWTEIVLKRERAMAHRASKTGNNSSALKSASSTPAARNSMQMNNTSYSRPFANPPRPSSADKPLPAGPTGVRDPRKMTESERRQKARTMLF
jgi:hypothetical protein